MISRLFKTQPYRGGPLFEQLSTHCFKLGDIVLELSVPASDFVMKEPPRMLNFPFQNIGWFDAHCKRGTLHDGLSVFCEIWNYFPIGMKRFTNLMAMGSNERMGGLAFNVQLSRVEKGQRLNRGEPNSLVTYIKWEHDQYHESVREKCDRRWKHGQPDQTNSDRQMHKSSLETYIKPLPTLDATCIGGVPWVHYNVKQGWAVTTDYYCTPLSEEYYLEVELEYRFEVSDENPDLLTPDMKRTADWLLQHIKFARLGNASEPLSLPTSTP